VKPGGTDAGHFAHLRTLSVFRLIQLRNLFDQHLREAPWRFVIIVVLLVVIWGSLYLLLTHVLKLVARWEFIAIVANQYIFIHFFLVLAVMLAFSNAILAFSSLFGRREAGSLLVMPVHARQVVLVKWLEGMSLSSWSFLLLGVPLMLAVASSSAVEWYYYPLFIAHFLGFVLIPATFGLGVAWLIAMYAPRRPLALAFWTGVLLTMAGAAWTWRLISQSEDSDRWLHLLMGQLAVARQPFFPSTWTAKGIVAAIDRQLTTSLMYLGVVLANAAFFSWLVINLIGRTWPEAYSRAQGGRYQPAVRRGRVSALLCQILFFYLPRPHRALMLKDLRGFTRDATQWTQMVIMFGLLVIYAANLRRLPVDWANPDLDMRGIIAALNLTTVSLILATFTGRFVFPLLSLESQQLWLLELLPIRRWTILLVKFLFALTLTSVSAVLVMGVSLYALELPAAMARLQLAVCLSVCVGLCGLSIGLGARFPMLGHRNPARIASGFGGTLNLVASMLFVTIEMAGIAYLGLRRGGLEDGFVSGAMLQTTLIVGLIGLGVGVAAVSLWIGGRHFERLEA
jgi:ABC-2 type transport system permease protein